MQVFFSTNESSFYYIYIYRIRFFLHGIDFERMLHLLIYTNKHERLYIEDSCYS